MTFKWKMKDKPKGQLQQHNSSFLKLKKKKKSKSRTGLEGKIKNIKGREQEIEVKWNKIIFVEFLLCETLCYILIRSLQIVIHAMAEMFYLPTKMCSTFYCVSFCWEVAPGDTKFPIFSCEYSHMSQLKEWDFKPQYSHSVPIW